MNMNRVDVSLVKDVIDKRRWINYMSRTLYTRYHVDVYGEHIHKWCNCFQLYLVTMRTTNILLKYSIKEEKKTILVEIKYK